MTKQTKHNDGAGTKQPTQKRETRTDALIALLREEGGKTAAELGAAVGWQVHSVRGFISGTLKKRSDLDVVSAKDEGGMRYSVRDRSGA